MPEANSRPELGAPAKNRGESWRNVYRLAHWATGVLYPWPRGKKLENGLILKIDPKNRWIDLNLAIKSKYEEGTLHLINRLLPEAGVFVDIGANIGVMSTFAARHVGTAGIVLAFEPDSVNFERLTWAREVNRLPQLLPFPIALGSKVAMMPLWKSPTGDGGLSSLVNVQGFDEYAGVPVVRLDDLIFALPVSRVDLIKIDVEGSENAVVEGAARVLAEFKPAVIMEMVTDEAVLAGEALLGCGYVSFLAGEKSNAHTTVVQKTAPIKLIHNNMLFIHESMCGNLYSHGLSIA